MPRIADQHDDEQVTYDYPFLAMFRKPMAVFVGALTVFVAAWLVSRIDTSIGKRE